MKELIFNWLKDFYSVNKKEPLSTLLENSSFQSHQFFWMLLFLVATLFLMYFLWYLTRQVLIVSIRLLMRSEKTKEYIDLLVKHRFFKAISHIFPLLFLDYFFSITFMAYPEVFHYAQRVTGVLFVIVTWIGLMRLFKAMGWAIKDKPLFKDKPVEAYVQTLNLILSLVFLIIILSVLSQRSPLFFLTSLGAMTAILLLIFKDTILGFVGSIQISINDMLRIGDWVEMPKYGADGDVTEINLTTVKVKNWDNTITTVPTYSFISDSFKNWRAMSEGGGRRIKRTIHIKISSIHFADQDLKNRLSKMKLLSDFISKQSDEIETYNKKHGLVDEYQINARRPTNLGLFRKYIDYYLKNNRDLNQKMWIVVRLLQETEHGLPLEVWCNSADTSWLAYEKVLGDIFDHLYSVIRFFDLEVHQSTTGSDLIKFSKELKQWNSKKESLNPNPDLGKD